jgi:hypothetical protein
MHTNRVYTIFWQPSSLPSSVASFQASPSYEDTVNAYFEHVAVDSHKFSNAYSVATQYYSGANDHIEYASSFGGSAMDLNPFPASECEDEQPEKGKSIKLKVCLTTQQLEEQIASVIESQGWTAGPESIFFLYTPEGVGGCFEAGEEASKGGECAYTYYCAYHYNFTPHSEEIIWANMPYEQTETCDDGAEPEGSDAGPAIDATSHEHNEAISDPTGTSWWDSEGGSEKVNPDYGEEMADLCDLPTFAETYGTLLVGSGASGTADAFNQAIDGHHYLLQQEWSDASGVPSGGKTPGACAQLLLPAIFTPPTNAAATQPAHFDGSASGIPGEDPVSRYSWDFGDGASGEGEAPVHTYTAPGDYTVTLIVEDVRGNTNMSTQQVRVAVAPAPEEESTTTTSTSSTSTASSTVTTTTTQTATAATTSTTTSSVPAHLSSAELAAMIGLPGNDATLAGSGAVTLGHTSCPPACSLAVSLYTTLRTTSRRHHRSSRRVLVGSAHITASSGAAVPIVVKLNATGRALLRRERRLVVQLLLSAGAQQGASIQLARTLTLTVPRHSVRR